MRSDISVLKYGSSVLATPQALTAVVHDIYREYRGGRRVIAVISAIGRETDRLLSTAESFTARPEPAHALASLLATGEKQSAALLTIALDRAGIPCRLAEPHLLNLRLEGDRLNGEPVSVNTDYLHRLLNDVPVVVVPGFIGLCRRGELALMGRSGSDLTAVVLADRLAATDCRLLKDVDAIYERDPAAPDGNDVPPRRFERVTWKEALRVSDGLIQPRAIEYLERRAREATVCTLFEQSGTRIGAQASSLREPAPRPRPLRAVLLGFGTVGRGVWEHCQQLPDHFEIVGIGVRSRFRHVTGQAPASLFSDDIDALLGRPHDVLIEVTGDVALAHAAISRTLAEGRSVVTANKAVLARHLPEFLEIAAGASGGILRYSAAVGGSAPMLEHVRKAAGHGPVRKLRGVLNGTSNLVLDRLLDGHALDEALAESRERGFAEANVESDLSGLDSEHKLRLLAHAAFGTDPNELSITRSGIESVTEGLLEAARQQAGRLRLVASIEAGGEGRVSVECLRRGDPLADVQAEHNRLLITPARGPEWQVSGKGAGRWPTAEAVIADLLDVRDRLALPVSAEPAQGLSLPALAESSNQSR